MPKNRNSSGTQRWIVDHTSIMSRSFLDILWLTIVLGTSFRCPAGIVTLITHGFNSDAGDWVQAMGEVIAEYPRRVFEYGASATTYLLTFDSNGALQQRRLSGSEPSKTASGDIVLLLDWNPYSGDLGDVIFN